jgi:hypothetical protein
MFGCKETDQLRIMRFFFHLEGAAGLHVDDVGQVFARPQDAIDHAFAMARQLGEQGTWRGGSLRVVDIRNNELLRVPILSSTASR